MADPLGDLTDAGVSIWLDDLSRARLADRSLARLIRDCHVVGVTTNPSIFHKAISGSDLYDGLIRDPGARGVEVEKALRAIVVRDVAGGCDLLRAAYDASNGVDGRVSIEVDPRLAHDTEHLKAALRPDTRVVIIGAGWIGLETAAAARAAGAHVTVLEHAALPLLHVLGPQLATVFADLHTEHGVDLRCGVTVRDLHPARPTGRPSARCGSPTTPSSPPTWSSSGSASPRTSTSHAPATWASTTASSSTTTC